MPISRSFSPIGMAPMSCSRINFASSMTGVSGLTQSTPLCITSLTFITNLRCLPCVHSMNPTPVRHALDYTTDQAPWDASLSKLPDGAVFNHRGISRNWLWRRSHFGHLWIAAPSSFSNGATYTSSFIGALHHWLDPWQVLLAASEPLI